MKWLSRGISGGGRKSLKDRRLLNHFVKKDIACEAIQGPFLIKYRPLNRITAVELKGQHHTLFQSIC